MGISHFFHVSVEVLTKQKAIAVCVNIPLVLL